jgi:glycosyltransferase involved in cell wall biosynthesis
MSGSVGIVMRTKNRALFLDRAVSSVLGQRYANWMLIVVNDGGDPAAVDAVLARHARHLDSRLTVVHNPTSVGMEAASNIGVTRATTDYILLHDDDDTVEPGFLEATIGFLESPDGAAYKGVASKVTKVVERVVDGRIVVTRRERYRPEIESIELSAMAHRNLLCPISFVYRRAVHDSLGFYDESLPVLGDWEFYLRFLAKHDVHLLPAALANYHVRPVAPCDAYGNSVAAAARQVPRHRAAIKNRLLRIDLERGAFGLGALLNSVAPTGAEAAAVDYSLQFIVRQLQHNARQDVVLYGTGGYARQLHDELTRNGITVACVVDSNGALWDTDYRFCGHAVRSLESALTSGHHTFVAGSFSYSDEIVGTIRREADRHRREVTIVAP